MNIEQDMERFIAFREKRRARNKSTKWDWWLFAFAAGAFYYALYAGINGLTG